MRSLVPSALACAAAAMLALGCSHAPPPSPTAPPSSGIGPGDTAPGSIPGDAPGTPPEAPPPPSGPPASSSPVSDYREVIKLHRANLSEDFILRTIKREGRDYRLGADDVIALRDSGVSERVIQAMLDSGRGLVTGEEQRPIAEDRVTIAPGEPDPSRRQDEVRWEGLVRRQDGVVLFKDRWHPGRLTLAENQIRWIDARDSTRNLLVPMNAVAEQFVTCLKRPGGNECFEWGFRTRTGETYRFRDVSWEQGEDARPLEVHDAIRARYPALVDSERDVDEMEK